MQRLAAEQIRILGQRLDGVRPKRAVAGHGLLGGHAVPGKPGHDLPHAVHAAELVGDDSRFLLGDALEFAEPLRGLGDDRQRIIAEFCHDFFSGGRPDVGQHAAGQVA